MAWHRKFIALKYTGKREINTERQQEMEVIRELCVKFAEENPDWGYNRIQGALSNVGYDVSDTTVGNILEPMALFPHLSVVENRIGSSLCVHIWMLCQWPTF